jgi:hypothetical protein
MEKLLSKNEKRIEAYAQIDEMLTNLSAKAKKKIVVHMERTFEVRLYPTATQTTALDHALHATRHLYGHPPATQEPLSIRSRCAI